jgi:transcriptional regulator with GAF, ATPase, and Fis domain
MPDQDAARGRCADPLSLSLASAPGVTARFQRRVRDGLGAASVTLDEAPVGDEAPVALLADRIDPALLDAVRRRRRRRLLVLVPDPDALTPAGVWEALAAGAADVLAWSEGPDPVVERLTRWRRVDATMLTGLVTRNVVGTSPAFRETLREVVEIGRFTDVSVLITGESGTGKELVARLIHGLDARRRDRDLVVVDCTTIVPSLSGSEFFGHERGAFTGAAAAREGAFALADGGTLFLDEVGELPLSLQAELLRVVQEGTYKPVGSNRWRRTDFRLVCATNRDLLEEEARGRFRRDFYFRIAQWRCHLPSLEERREDILPLARHFLAELAGGEPPELDPVVRALLLARAYPGNVRELRQLVARLHATHVGPGPITAGEVPAADRPPVVDPTDGGDHDAALIDPLDAAVAQAVTAGIPLKVLAGRVRERAIDAALQASPGSLAGSARLLGITDRALQMHLRKARLARDGTELAREGAPDNGATP